MRQGAAAEKQDHLNDSHKEVEHHLSVVLDPELVTVVPTETNNELVQSVIESDKPADDPVVADESEVQEQSDALTQDESEDQDPKIPNISSGESYDAEASAVQRFLNKAAENKLLTAQEEVDLSKRIEDGDLEAKNYMVEANLLLVASIAKKFIPQSKSISYLELINEGVFGLNRAAEKFDWRKGYKFSTYATWWIRQSIQRALEDKDLAIRLPNDDIRRGRKIGAARNRLMNENAAEPTYEQIAEATDLEVDVVVRIQSRPRADRSLDQPISTNNANSDGSLTYLSEIIPDERTVDEAINKIYKAGKLDALGAALESLPEKEREIVEMHYGIGREKMSYVDIGKIYGVSGEYIRKIEKLVLQKLSGNKGLIDAKAS